MRTDAAPAGAEKTRRGKTRRLGGPAMFQAEIETMPRAVLAALQLRRLKTTIRRVWRRVPAYRRKFEAAGVTPDSLGALGDLAKFPFTVKDDLRDGYPFGMVAVPREKLRRVHASSGTTGTPTVVAYTQSDLKNWADLMARSLAAAGARPGDIVQNAHGYGLFTGGLGVHDGATRLGCTVVPASGGNSERQVVLIRDLGVDVLCGTPSYVLNISEVAQSMGVDLGRCRLRLGVFGAEPWSETMRHRLEERLGIRAVDLYGLSEILGPGVACECAEGGDGLHGWEDHFLFEIVDPDSGDPVSPGQTGELVITTLTKQALPLVRYRTRDITRLSTERCPCGRTHLRLQRITGRSDDMLIIRGVNLYPSQIEALLLDHPGVTPNYQLVLRREGVMDGLTIEVEATPAESPRSYRTIAEQVRHRIRSMVGLGCDVVVKRPGEVPRSDGKAARVRDLREGHRR